MITSSVQLSVMIADVLDGETGQVACCQIKTYPLVLTLHFRLQIIQRARSSAVRDSVTVVALTLTGDTSVNV